MSDNSDRCKSEAKMTQAVVVEIEEQFEGERADVVLGRSVPGLSRRVARKLSLEGRLFINVSKAPPSQRVELGDRVELRVPCVEATAAVASVEVLATTPHFVYVEKPPGLHTHALVPGDANCLSARVVELFPECASASEDPREGGAVHRLDYQTSGVVAFARDRETWVAAREAFTKGLVRKRYLAVCHAPASWPPPQPEGALQGWLSPAEQLAAVGIAFSSTNPLEQMEDQDSDCQQAVQIRAPLGAGESRNRVGVRLDGQRSRTIVCPLRAPHDGLVLTQLELVTGHRHQARVHLAWTGMPILGDELYSAGTDAGGLFLHAYAIDFSAAFAEELKVTTNGHARLIDRFYAGLAPVQPVVP